jgi:ferritin
VTKNKINFKYEKQMKTNNLSKSLASALNAQMNKKVYSSQIYLNYALWAEEQGFKCLAKLLFEYAKEEHSHMIKILKFTLKRGAEINITDILAPFDEPDNIDNFFKKIFEYEVDITKTFYNLTELCLYEEDWETLGFMKWFLNGKTEEETLSTSLLDKMDKMKIAAYDNANSFDLFSLDNDSGYISDGAISA